MSAPSASGPVSSSTHPADHVNLRVTYLIAGNPRPPHDLGLVAASTTVAELRARLQQELLEHPLPHEQRLIYQGRPLMNSGATLRDALRIEGPIGPLPYTIHIIIASRPASSQFRPQHAQTVPQGLHYRQQPLAQNPPIAPEPNDQFGGWPPQQGHQEAQAMAQQSIQFMQQQMAMLNPALAQTMAQLPPNGNTTISIQHMQMPMRMQHQHHHGHTPNVSPQPNPDTDQPPIEGVPNEPTGYDAAATPTVNQPNAANSGMADPLAGLRHAHGLDPIPRSTSAPGHPPVRNQATQQPPRYHDHHNHAPSMGRTGGFFGGLPLPAPPHMHLPFPFTGSMAPRPSATTQPTVWLASSRNGPEALLFAPGHGFYTTIPPVEAQPSATSTEALPTPPLTQAPIATAAGTASTQLPQHTPTVAPQPQGVHARLHHPRRQQPQNQPANANPNAPANPLNPNPNPNAENNDDLFALVIQRGWLFLRLYMFMFVLSEPGTWRRYALLFAAIVVCILPRRNPLNNAFVAARRHIDNLIGPPNPNAPDREGAAQQGADVDRLGHQRQQPNQNQPQSTPQNQPQSQTQAGPSSNPNPNPTPTPHSSMPTPQETADRLLQQRRQQNPNANFLIGLFYRIEQAIALFLASLIPGVGERHVAAREEIRRQEERARNEAEIKEKREAEEKRVREEGEGGEEGGEGSADVESEKRVLAEQDEQVMNRVEGWSADEKGKGKEAIQPETEQASMSNGSYATATAGAMQDQHQQLNGGGELRQRFT